MFLFVLLLLSGTGNNCLVSSQLVSVESTAPRPGNPALALDALLGNRVANGSVLSASLVQGYCGTPATFTVPASTMQNWWTTVHRDHVTQVVTAPRFSDATVISGDALLAVTIGTENTAASIAFGRNSVLQFGGRNASILMRPLRAKASDFDATPPLLSLCFGYIVDTLSEAQLALRSGLRDESLVRLDSVCALDVGVASGVISPPSSSTLSLINNGAASQISKACFLARAVRLAPIDVDGRVTAFDSPITKVEVVDYASFDTPIEKSKDLAVYYDTQWRALNDGLRIRETMVAMALHVIDKILVAEKSVIAQIEQATKLVIRKTDECAAQLSNRIAQAEVIIKAHVDAATAQVVDEIKKSRAEMNARFDNVDGKLSEISGKLESIAHAQQEALQIARESAASLASLDARAIESDQAAVTGAQQRQFAAAAADALLWRAKMAKQVLPASRPASNLIAPEEYMDIVLNTDSTDESDAKRSVFAALRGYDYGYAAAVRRRDAASNYTDRHVEKRAACAPQPTCVGGVACDDALLAKAESAAVKTFLYAVPGAQGAVAAFDAIIAPIKQLLFALERESSGRLQPLPVCISQALQPHYKNVCVRQFRYSLSRLLPPGVAITIGTTAYMSVYDLRLIKLTSQSLMSLAKRQKLDFERPSDVQWILRELEHSSQFSAAGGIVDGYIARYLAAGGVALWKVVTDGKLNLSADCPFQGVLDEISLERDAKAKAGIIANNVFAALRGGTSNTAMCNANAPVGTCAHYGDCSGMLECGSDADKCSSGCCLEPCPDVTGGVTCSLLGENGCVTPFTAVRRIAETWQKFADRVCASRKRSFKSWIKKKVIKPVTDFAASATSDIKEAWSELEDDFKKSPFGMALGDAVEFVNDVKDLLKDASEFAKDFKAFAAEFVDTWRTIVKALDATTAAIVRCANKASGRGRRRAVIEAIENDTDALLASLNADARMLGAAVLLVNQTAVPMMSMADDAAAMALAALSSEEREELIDSMRRSAMAGEHSDLERVVERFAAKLDRLSAFAAATLAAQATSVEQSAVLTLVGELQQRSDAMPNTAARAEAGLSALRELVYGYGLARRLAVLDTVNLLERQSTQRLMYTLGNDTSYLPRASLALTIQSQPVAELLTEMARRSQWKTEDVAKLVAAPSVGNRRVALWIDPDAHAAALAQMAQTGSASFDIRPSLVSARVNRKARFFHSVLQRAAVFIVSPALASVGESLVTLRLTHGNESLYVNASGGVHRFDHGSSPSMDIQYKPGSDCALSKAEYTSMFRIRTAKWIYYSPYTTWSVTFVSAGTVSWPQVVKAGFEIVFEFEIEYSANVDGVVEEPMFAHDVLALPAVGYFSESVDNSTRCSHLYDYRRWIRKQPIEIVLGASLNKLSNTAIAPANNSSVSAWMNTFAAALQWNVADLNYTWTSSSMPGTARIAIGLGYNTSAPAQTHMDASARRRRRRGILAVDSAPLLRHAPTKVAVQSFVERYSLVVAAVSDSSASELVYHDIGTALGIKPESLRWVDSTTPTPTATPGGFCSSSTPPVVCNTKCCSTNSDCSPQVCVQSTRCCGVAALQLSSSLLVVWIAFMTTCLSF